MIDINHINWYPGHMAKAKRFIIEKLPLIDAVIELRDARVPISSANPNVKKIISSKPKVVALNKSSLADASATAAWLQKIKADEKCAAVSIDCKTGEGQKDLITEVNNLLAEKKKKYTEKGMASRALRVMVIGVTNVGKSTFFNLISKSKKAKVENRPGVTRETQWVSTPYGIELLDTPGLLWEKLEVSQGINLALTGAIKDDILDVVELSWHFCEFLKKNYPEFLEKRFKILPEADDGKGILEAIAKKRGFIISGGELDEERAANTVIDEFRKGLIGRISLEKP